MSQGPDVNRFVPWKNVAYLEVIPHPALENIGVIRIETRPKSPLVKNRLLRRFLGLRDEKPIMEMPFEPGQIESATALELYEKHRVNQS